jgi:UDP-N-acetylglucosamine 3-dehydrogenase
VTLRVGVIGCGTVARRVHLPAFTQLADATVVACASRTRASAEAAAAEAPGADVVDSWEELIGRDDIDAVDICSPNVFHREQAVTAAKAGKHVLVEKPIACDVAEAEEMIAAAEAAGVVLHVTQNLRYIAPVIAAHDVIASGAIGEIKGLRSAFGHAGPRDWAPDATWFFDPASSGGGALVDLGIHIIDLVRYVTGLEATQVSAMTLGDGPVEDAAQVLVRYDGGAIGSVHASWVARPAPDLQLTIFGSEGTLHFDPRSSLAVRRADGSKQDVEMPDVTATPYGDFARAIAGAEPEGPAATGGDGLAALQIVCAAYGSAATGSTVEVRT